MGLESLLPKSAKIAIIDPELGEEEGMLGLVDWDRVVEQPGVQFEPQGFYPERYRPNGRLSAEFLAGLGVE